MMIFSVSEGQQPKTCVTYFNNPSFEGWKFFLPGVAPPEWSACGPGTTPDMQPGFFDVDLQPTDGQWFLGICHQVQTGWQEGVTQRLNFPFEPNIIYSFKIDVANSRTTKGGMIPDDARLLIYGGNSECDQDTLLWSSNIIPPLDSWMTLNVFFTTDRPITHITFKCYAVREFDGANVCPYLLLDNIRDVSPARFNITTESIVVKEPTCYGLSDGIVKSNTIGKFSPFSYSWSNGSLDSISTVSAGQYVVTVTDSTGCSVTSSIEVGEPAPLQVTDSISYSSCKTCDAGQAEIFVNGGIAPYSYEWSTGDTTSQIVALPEGKYGYMVTDSNGCSVSGEVSIINTHEFNVFIPNAFTPNGDGNNDYLEAFGNRLNWKKMSIQIFSREGTLVFESNQPDFKWDGKYMGQSLSSGVYVYVFKVTYLDTHVDEMRNGSITIIK